MKYWKINYKLKKVKKLRDINQSFSLNCVKIEKFKRSRKKFKALFIYTQNYANLCVYEHHVHIHKMHEFRNLTLAKFIMWIKVFDIPLYITPTYIYIIVIKKKTHLLAECILWCEGWAPHSAIKTQSSIRLEHTYLIRRSNWNKGRPKALHNELLFVHREIDGGGEKNEPLRKILPTRDTGVGSNPRTPTFRDIDESSKFVGRGR